VGEEGGDLGRVGDRASQQGVREPVGGVLVADVQVAAETDQRPVVVATTVTALAARAALPVISAGRYTRSSARLTRTVAAATLVWVNGNPRRRRDVRQSPAGQLRTRGYRPYPPSMVTHPNLARPGTWA
jgi:hypothetical protein